MLDNQPATKFHDSRLFIAENLFSLRLRAKRDRSRKLIETQKCKNVSFIKLLFRVTRSASKWCGKLNV